MTNYFIRLSKFIISHCIAFSYSDTQHTKNKPSSTIQKRDDKTSEFYSAEPTLHKVVLGPLVLFSKVLAAPLMGIFGKTPSKVFGTKILFIFLLSFALTELKMQLHTLIRTLMVRQYLSILRLPQNRPLKRATESLKVSKIRAKIEADEK